ncbi:MAG TPA: alpha/beta hydrolase [Chthoniobacteraceae bacterium]|jgi:hypothetical protein|nr:alpha/beta hydrolase [Chthoniobacteraceae bacterium]
MSHFLLFPTDETGRILEDINKVKAQVASLAGPLFDFNEFYIYSHGWWTNANHAMLQYNEFSLGMVVEARQTAAAGHAVVPPVLATGIHWPSMLSEDENSLLNAGEFGTFYSMEKRADGIGQNAVYALIYQLLTTLSTRNAPFHINLIGHSFGCKVICAALQKIAQDTLVKPTPRLRIPANANFNIVLLQAAFDDDALNKGVDGGKSYGGISEKIPNTRFLVTYSAEDIALKDLYPVAQVVHGMFNDALHPPQALGGKGLTNEFMIPTAGHRMAVDIGFQFDPGLRNHRVVNADLAPFHRGRPGAAVFPVGHHNDIFATEIYRLILSFLPT